MVYRVIGLMSGSSLDGLDIAFVEFHETSGRWTYQLKNSACYEYSRDWIEKLRGATRLQAADYQLLHVEYGHYLGEQVNRFIDEHQLQYQVQLIASHGHTTFHEPLHKMTAQLGDGAAIAAITGINVVSDLRAIDVALGGQGAPIVPIGERLLLGDYRYFLNLGGIANISFNDPDNYVAFDICPANRILNMLAKPAGKAFDDGGKLAEKGEVIQGLLQQLNSIEYYRMPFPKSLSNDFGLHVVYPLIKEKNYDPDDALRTYVEHICVQIALSIETLQSAEASAGLQLAGPEKLLASGGGARNHFLMRRLREMLQRLNVGVEIPEDDIVDFKEAIIMGLIGVLRWREENNVLASVTGASRDSIGGAVWMGLEA